MPDVTYRIGDIDMTVGSYSFQEQPKICDYEQTITLDGVPDFVEHDDLNREFTVFETYDQSLVGSYPVTIKTLISVPTDYTKTSFVDYEAEQTFMIYVEPCKVDTIDANIVMPDMYYNIGEPDLFEQYDFIQIPFCQYTFTQTPFIAPGQPFTHDLTLREWVVSETLDLSLIGAYPITLRHEIEQYTDYTKSKTEIIFNEYEFTIYINPCIVTDYIVSL